MPTSPSVSVPSVGNIDGAAGAAVTLSQWHGAGALLFSPAYALRTPAHEQGALHDGAVLRLLHGAAPRQAGGVQAPGPTVRRYAGLHGPVHAVSLDNCPHILPGPLVPNWAFGLSPFIWSKQALFHLGHPNHDATTGSVSVLNFDGAGAPAKGAHVFDCRLTAYPGLHAVHETWSSSFTHDVQCGVPFSPAHSPPHMYGSG